MKIQEVLARKPHGGVETVKDRDEIRQLTKILREKRIGAVMVLDDRGALAGVISERDIVRALAEEGELCLGAPVSRYMTRNVIATSPEETAESVLGRMTDGRFRHMPVLKDGRMIGVVSIGDLVKARIDALQRDNEALEEFIRG